MFSKEKIKRYVSGLTLAILICSLTVGTFAATAKKQIEVLYSNIKLVVDGQNVIFGKDSSGNQIEPFIYNGTTYLPVRAVGDSIGKAVSWDGKTQTVFIGLKPDELNYMTEVIEPYQNSTNIYKLNDTRAFYMSGKAYSNGYKMGGHGDAYLFFNLDSQYTEINGDLGAIYWEFIGQDRFFNIYLDGKLFQSIEVKNSDLAQKITIPVTGVKQLKIDSPYSGYGGSNGGTYIGFGNVMIK